MCKVREVLRLKHTLGVSLRQISEADGLLIRGTVEAPITDTTVEILHKGSRIASHARSGVPHRDTAIKSTCRAPNVAMPSGRRWRMNSARMELKSYDKIIRGYGGKNYENSSSPFRHGVCMWRVAPGAYARQ